MRPRRQAKFPNKRHCEWYDIKPDHYTKCEQPTKFVLRLSTGDRFGYCAECVEKAEALFRKERREFKRSVVRWRRPAAKEE